MGSPASVLKLDRGFFAESVVPLLRQRGFGATTAAELLFELDDQELEHLLSKSAVPMQGTIRATLQVWQQLVSAATAPQAPISKPSRDLGPAMEAAQTWVRQNSGKRVKGRSKATAKVEGALLPPSSGSAIDPAAFALANLGRLASIILTRIHEQVGDWAPRLDAIVVLQGGVVVVDGVAMGRCSPGGKEPSQLLRPQTKKTSDGP